MSTIYSPNDISPVNQQALNDGIKAAFQYLGYTLIDEYLVSTTKNLVFQKSLGLGKTYDSVYFQISITSALAISQILHTAWNSTTHVGANSGAASASVTFLTTSPISLKTFKSGVGEFDLVVVYQSLTSCILGWLRPVNLNAVDENFYNCFLQFATLNSRTFQGVATGVSLLATATWNTIGGEICLTNHYNKNDIVPKFIIYNPAKSVFGITSDDLAFGAGNGLSLFVSVGDWYKVWNGGSTYSSIYLK